MRFARLSNTFITVSAGRLVLAGFDPAEEVLAHRQHVGSPARSGLLLTRAELDSFVKRLKRHHVVLKRTLRHLCMVKMVRSHKLEQAFCSSCRREGTFVTLSSREVSQNFSAELKKMDCFPYTNFNHNLEMETIPERGDRYRLNWSII